MYFLHSKRRAYFWQPTSVPNNHLYLEIRLASTPTKTPYNLDQHLDSLAHTDKHQRFFAPQQLSSFDADIQSILYQSPAKPPALEVVQILAPLLAHLPPAPPYNQQQQQQLNKRSIPPSSDTPFSEPPERESFHRLSVRSPVIVYLPSLSSRIELKYQKPASLPLTRIIKHLHLVRLVCYHSDFDPALAKTHPSRAQLSPRDLYTITAEQLIRLSVPCQVWPERANYQINQEFIFSNPPTQTFQHCNPEFLLSVIVEYFSRLDVMTAIRKAYLAERKRKNRSRKHADKRTSELSLTLDDTDRRYKVEVGTRLAPSSCQASSVAGAITSNETTNNRSDQIVWSSKRYIPLELYPHMLGNDPDRPPTVNEIKYCKELTQNFKYFDHGKVVIHDKDQESKIIAMIEFTRWDQLTPIELDEIRNVTQFLFSAKQFVNPVDSDTRSWGGQMFAIGWRKAMIAFQLIGIYRNKAAIAKSPSTYDTLMRKSTKISSILGRMFRHLANVAFQDNQDIMKSNSIPSLGHLAFNMPINDDDCSPNLTFTTDGFFNSPHFDKDDISEFAFGLFIPVNKNDWTIADSSKLKGGEFVFPDYRCGIDFAKHDGFVKLVWRSKEVRHCTLNSDNDSTRNQLGISMQINKKTASTSRDTKSGAIFKRRTYRDKPKEACYIGDHDTYVKGHR
ncbi:hypothetical protein PGT21_010249 [Puccinia graminis f. sp. tritici]|uniref:Tet-like 2OG-Fe(II) oxygenase domain-containing protein n=1 Tax=Puccinia graminis f. sp. tritici TaxID=56615 RepID=A0A5B0QW07_PUCGR|nr:hypothetical protein PGT21_010249 [Puccinia graminis f. sp. tritici]